MLYKFMEFRSLLVIKCMMIELSLVKIASIIIVKLFLRAQTSKHRIHGTTMLVISIFVRSVVEE